MIHLDESRRAVLVKLERLGAQDDSRAAGERMLNITPETGELLVVLALAMHARRVLEIGTSNGYSTIWLATAMERTGGSVETIERSAAKVAMARANLDRAGVASRVTITEGEAGDVLLRHRDGSADLVFLDSDRARYGDWWREIDRVLRPGGLLVVDNATSHPDQMAPLRALIDARGDYAATVVAVGKGELLAVKAARQ